MEAEVACVLYIAMKDAVWIRFVFTLWYYGVRCGNDAMEMVLVIDSQGKEWGIKCSFRSVRIDFVGFSHVHVNEVIIYMKTQSTKDDP